MDSLIQKTVADFIHMLGPKTNDDHTIDMDRLDYGFYGNHQSIRPYQTIEEGIEWYANRKEIQGLPESMILPMVAHNFNMSVVEACAQMCDRDISIVELN